MTVLRHNRYWQTTRRLISLGVGIIDISTNTNLSASSPIVLTGDILSHANSGVSAGSYVSVTVDAKGHITAGLTYLNTPMKVVGGTTSRLTIEGAAGNTRDIGLASGADFRWFIRCTSTTESGSDAGSNFELIAISDALAANTPISVPRIATGVIQLARSVQISGYLGVNTAPGSTYRLNVNGDGLLSGLLIVQSTLDAVGNTTIGSATVTRGVLTVVRGSSTDKAGVVGLVSKGGTLRYLFFTDAGALRHHTSLPSGDSDGSAVGIVYTHTAPINVSGTTISHDNSAVSPGTYTSVTVDAKGHVTAGSNPSASSTATSTAFDSVTISGAGTTQTVDVSGKGMVVGNYALANTGISTFSNGVSGQQIIVTQQVGAVTLTINAGSAIILNGGACALSLNQTITFVYQDSKWKEIARSP